MQEKLAVGAKKDQPKTLIGFLLIHWVLIHVNLNGTKKGRKPIGLGSYSVVTYSRNAAKGIVRKDGRIARVEYRGPIGLDGFADLVGNVISATCDSASVFVRMDKATFLLAEPPPVHQVLNEIVFPPAVLVVEPHQYELWRDYAKNLATAGVSCAIFAKSQLELAEMVARTLAL